MENDISRAVNALPGLVWTALPNGQIDFLNHRWCEYTGLRLDEGCGNGWQAAVHPDDLPRLVDRWRSIVSSGEPGEMEARLRRFDGEYRCFLMSSNPMRDEAGQILKWYGVNTDIEDRTRSEEALRLRELSFSLIVESIPVPVAVTTPSGEVEALNRPTLEYFGKTFQELKGWKSSDVVHPDDLQHTIAAQLKAHETGRAYNVESRHRRADGIYRWFNVLGLPLRDTQGRILRWFHLLIDIDDQKRADAELRRAYDSFADGQRLSRTGNFTADIAADDHIWSAELYRIFEIDPARKITTQAVRDIIHPEDLPSFDAGFARSLGGADFDLVFRIVTRSGNEKHVHAIGHLIEQVAGRPLFIGAIQDVTQSKLAEEALRESERESRLIVDSIPGLVATLTPGGEVEGVNKQVLEYCGRTPEEIKQWGTSDIAHPEDLPRVIEAINQAIASGEPYEIEERVRRFDGVYRWFQVRGLPLRDSNGRIVRWYVLLTDIDARKRAEDELRRSEAFLAEGLRVSSTGTFSWRMDTDEVTLSEGLRRMYELDQNATPTVEQLFGLIHPEDIPMLVEKREQIRADNAPYEHELRVRMPDGRVKYLRTVGKVIRHQDGRLESVGATQDVTQRRLAEAALDKLRSEVAHVTRVMSLGALTASIAHEVNQPLSGIVTNASTCLRTLDADPPNVDLARETARRIIRDGNRASDVITRLRALFSKKELTLESLDLNDATREVISLSMSDLQRNRVILQSELADNLPRITGDRVQLQQVILNLLRNGSDAMVGVDNRPRQLLVTTERDEGDRVRLSVKDVGTGFAPQDAEKLFEAFHTTKKEGMGIGLSVSRSIIERHQGRLWAQPNDGPGATFSFSIPCRTDTNVQ